MKMRRLLGSIFVIGIPWPESAITKYQLIFWDSQKSV